MEVEPDGDGRELVGYKKRVRVRIRGLILDLGSGSFGYRS